MSNSSIRLDQVEFTTLFESYKNYNTESTSLVIPADTLINTETRNYTIDITYSRGGTRADTYLIGNGVKILANANTRLIVGGPYQFKSVETASVLLGYDSDSMTVLVSIFNNTGGNLTLIPQTIIVSMVQYDAPITSI